MAIANLTRHTQTRWTWHDWYAVWMGTNAMHGYCRVPGEEIALCCHFEMKSIHSEVADIVCEQCRREHGHGHARTEKMVTLISMVVSAPHSPTFFPTGRHREKRNDDRSLHQIEANIEFFIPFLEQKQRDAVARKATTKVSATQKSN